MDNNFWQYIDHLQLIAFFSGYPLIYAIVMVVFENKSRKWKIFPAGIHTLLPYAYALSGTLYLGLILKGLYPDYSINSIRIFFDHSLLKIWAVFSLIFWIPLFAKKPVISLLHSLPFFIFFIKDVFILNPTSGEHDMIRNEIKIYSDSLILNLITLVVVLILFFIIKIVYKKLLSH